MAYVRTVRTKSGSIAVQIVWKSRQGGRDIEHLGSARTDAEVEVLKAVAAQRIAAGQEELPLGVAVTQEPAALPIVASRMGRLLDVIAHGYRQLGFDQAAGGDVVFEQLVTARIIEPSSKQDAARVLTEAGLRPLSYRTVKRRLPVYAQTEWRRRLSGACATHAELSPSTLVLYDVTTLWFETDTGDGFREPGFSKERRLEPQITVGLLTDAGGAPLMLDAFEGNTAETKTMIPLIRDFVDAHGIVDVIVVADAGMMSEANLKDIEDAGWSFIIAGKLPDIPYQVKKWHTDHPDQPPVDQMILSQTTFMGPKADQRQRRTHYQYRAERARRSLHGIDTQIRKAEQAIAGKAAIKRNRFVQLAGGTRSLNRDLETKVRGLAGWKPYVTNLLDADAAYVIASYHQLWHVEHSFRMSKHDLKARPIYHHKRESIDAHLAIVFTALAISHWLETRTGWTIKHLVRELRRYRQVTIRAGTHTLTAEDPIPNEIRQMLAKVHPEGAH